MSMNRQTVGLAIAALVNTGDTQSALALTAQHKEKLSSRATPNAAQPALTKLPPSNPVKTSTSVAKSLGGPGTELKLLLEEMGITPKKTCGCNQRAAEMDAYGPAVVRQHKDTWVRFVTEQYHAASWWTCAKAAAIAVTHGLPLTIEGLIEEACRRAEAKNELAK